MTCGDDEVKDEDVPVALYACVGIIARVTPTNAADAYHAHDVKDVRVLVAINIAREQLSVVSSVH